MKELEIAKRAVLEAGDFLLGNFGKRIVARYRSGKGLVSEFDLEAERIIISLLKKEFPNYGVIGEETGVGRGDSESTWIIDPLDCTTNSVVGVPIFAVSVALARENQVLASAIYIPTTKELISAEKSKGAFLNNERITVSDQSDINKALVVFGRGRSEENIKRFLKNFVSISELLGPPRIFGSTVYEFTTVACGKADLLINNGASIWDYAAGTLLVSEAGGKVSDFAGEDWDISKKEVVASNGFLHEKTLAVLNS